MSEFISTKTHEFEDITLNIPLSDTGTEIVTTAEYNYNAVMGLTHIDI